MDKKILNITSENYIGTHFIERWECEEILKKAGRITDADYEHAINVIIAKMCKDQLLRIEVDVYEREREYTPAKEMTISDIEKELGYKVKIVKEK